MRTFLILALLAVSVRGCDKAICEFVYNKPNWEEHSSIEDTKFEVTVEQGKVTGIVTASFDIISPTCVYKKTTWQLHDFLRFYTRGSGEPFQSLVVKIRYSTDTYFDINGKNGNAEKVGDTDRTITRKAADIQISDQYTDYYKIYLGDPGDATSVNYNFESEDNWNWFQNVNNEVRLRDTVRIKNGGRCTIFKYISACSDATPRLSCDEQEPITQTVNLGSPYTLTCSGFGAPYLDVKWTKDGEPTVIQPTNAYSDTATEADHRIKSTVTIDRVSTDHLGTWTCTILNKNFMNSVTKTYTLQYTHFVSLISSSPLDYYTANSEDTEFEWVIQGWPLDQVTLNCGDEDMVTRDESGYTSSTPPQVRLTLTLRNQDVVTCALRNGDKDLDTRQITKVGYKCEAGEGGVGKDCEECPARQTSKAGVGECFSPESACSEGYWGYSGVGCQPCPDNQTSRPKTVKMLECFLDVSYCLEGQYGYATNCTQCPGGKTSYAETKKEAECFLDVSYCAEGQFGYGNNCNQCTEGYTSHAKTKKEAECFLDVSNCAEGQFGYGNNCNQCTEGYTSHTKTKKGAECFLDVSNCAEGQFGFENNCTQCPEGRTSSAETKKDTACFPDVSHCAEGQYGYGTNCFQCPGEKTSYAETKKETACFPDVSYCTEGQYGYESDCSECPVGKTSKAFAKQAHECVEPQANIAVPVGTGAGGLVFILAILLVIILVIRKRRRNSGDDLISRTEPSTGTEVDAPRHLHVTDPESDLPDSDYTYAVINRAVTVNRFKASGNSSRKKSIAVSNRVPSSTDNFSTTQDGYQLEVMGSNLTPLNTEGNASYATLGEVQRTSSPTHDEEESAYSCLDRSGTNKTRGTHNMEINTDLQEDDSLYAKIADR